MPFIIGILLVLLAIGWYLEKFLIKKNWSNPFLNTFYIFNMIFSSPFNVIFGIIIIFFIGAILALYQIDIGNSSSGNKHLDLLVEVIMLSTTSIVLFVVFTIFSALVSYILWIDRERLKINYQSLIEFSKIFAFRIPLLIVTLGLFLPNLMMGKITSLCYEIMIHGLYIVPIFMLITKKINFWIKNN
ncbi:hypothetical protein L5F37_06840 [Aliarcobacter butzleri]|uniref:hypothetical protein n=1 Tax=Aliarcobacter butzleri TaxID=28197 RepID=UPI001EDA44E6|nr:hypothetical protein [Aliarcobacter butzleri]MCG3663113.1 hypothetical protein [Aliarcobacter butzleri]